MIDSNKKSLVALKRVPRPLSIDPNQRYSLAETHAALDWAAERSIAGRGLIRSARLHVTSVFAPDAEKAEPKLEIILGQSLSATLNGERINWEIGRTRGLSI